MMPKAKIRYANSPAIGRKRLGGRLRTVDVGLAGSMQRRGCGQHDRQRDEVAERHADPGIQPNTLESRRSLFGRLGELFAPRLFALVFGFLR